MNNEVIEHFGQWTRAEKLKQNTPRKKCFESEVLRCNLCNTDKPSSEFYRTSQGKIRAGCKACRRAQSAKTGLDYRKKNRAKEKARFDRWKKENRKRYNQLVCAGVKRYRRRKRDRGQQFFDLCSAQNSATLSHATALPLQQVHETTTSPRPRTRARKTPPAIS